MLISILASSGINLKVRSSLSTMIPSPTYTAKRSVEDNFEQHQQQQPNYPSRFTPTSVEDVVSTRREQRPQARSVCFPTGKYVNYLVNTCM